MKKPTIFTMALALCAFLSLPAFGLDQMTPKTDESGTQAYGSTFRPEPEGLSTLIGEPVTSRMGENLGTIDDIVIDESGRIKYFILAERGRYGAGERLIPVPWRAADARFRDDEITFNLERKELEKAPYFRRTTFPDFTQRRWDRKIYSYYGLDPRSDPYYRDNDRYRCRGRYRDRDYDRYYYYGRYRDYDPYYYYGRDRDYDRYRYYNRYYYPYRHRRYRYYNPYYDRRWRGYYGDRHYRNYYYSPYGHYRNWDYDRDRD